MRNINLACAAVNVLMMLGMYWHGHYDIALLGAAGAGFCAGCALYES